MSGKTYRCFECNKRIVPTRDGYWRHYRKPLDGHKPSPNQSLHDRDESLELAGDIILGATHPTLFVIKKTVETAADIYKRLKDGD